MGGAGESLRILGLYCIEIPDTFRHAVEVAFRELRGPPGAQWAAQVCENEVAVERMLRAWVAWSPGEPAPEAAPR